MRVVGAILGAVALSAIRALVVLPSAHASNFGFELNGTYSFLSNGEWAKATTPCTTNRWTAPLKFTVDRWIVHRELPNWAPCETGGAVTGHQAFMFYPVDDDGQISRNTDLLAGTDITRTDSGSCGKNLPLNIVIPLRLQRIG